MFRKILASIFPGLFVAVGAFFLIKGGIPSIGKYFEHKNHVHVEAKYVGAEIKEEMGNSGKTEYFLTAKYQYTLEGEKYILEKFQNTINSAHLQKNKKSSLEYTRDRWEEEGFETFRIDPKEPNKIQKGDPVTIGPLLLIIILPSLFIFIGAAIIILIFRKKKINDTLDRPWLEKKDWQSHVLSCNTKKKKNGSIFFSLFWNAISMPMAYLLFFSGRPIESNAVYIALIFPLIGIISIIYTLKKIQDYIRYGSVQLKMDPFPASIGGDFGGALHFQRNLPKGATVAIKLNCLKLVKTGSGDDRRTKETLLWYTTGHAFINSKDIEFRLAIEDGLQESSLTSLGIHYRAEISVSYDNHHFDRQFEIPVFATNERSSIKLDSANHPAAKEHASDLINDVTEFTKNGDNYFIRFPILRLNKGGLLLGILIGGSLLGATIFNIVYQEIPFLFTIVFGLLGLVFFGLSMFEAFFSVKVQVEPNQLLSRSKWMGITYSQKSVMKDQIDSFQIGDYYKKNATGGKHASYYRISLITKDQKKVLVAIRLKNRATAEEMKHFFESYFNIKNTEEN